MTIYCDTSLLIATLTAEEASERVAAWMATQRSDDLVISPWVDAEVASALAIKQRTGMLNATLRARAEAAWRAMARGLTHAEVVASDFIAVAGLVDSGRGLRAGDALHVAIAQRLGSALATLDGAMMAGAAAAGLRVEPVPPA